MPQTQAMRATVVGSEGPVREGGQQQLHGPSLAAVPGGTERAFENLME